MALRAISPRRWMALSFALGSICFIVGPLSPYVKLVGEHGDGLTFFAGSILFTIGGALQSLVAWPNRRRGRGGRAGWWTAIVQLVGTLLFNVMTYRALHVASSNPHYNTLVWRPDWAGSACFLVSGAIAYWASQRDGWGDLLPVRGGEGWWQPAVNLLGCILFGVSAIGGYVPASTGGLLNPAAANWGTILGALCFLACGVDTLNTDKVSKMPLIEELRELEEEIVSEVREIGSGGGAETDSG